MGRKDDLTTKMCVAGMALDDHMLITVFIDTLPPKHELVPAKPAGKADPTVEENMVGAVKAPTKTVVVPPTHRGRWWFGRGCRW